MQMLVQLLARDASLDTSIEILRIDLQNAIHSGQIDAKPARQRGDVALKRSTRPKRDYRRLVIGAKPDDGGDFVGALRKGYCIWSMRGMIGLILAVLGAHR